MKLLRLTETKTKCKLLIKGESTAGKTYKAGFFPRPVFIDFDNNLSGLRQVPKELRDNIMVINPYVDDDGKDLIGIQLIDNFNKLTIELSNCNDIDTIVIDSITAMQDAFIYAIVGKKDAFAIDAHQKVNGYSFWKSLKNHLDISLDNMLSSKTNKNVVAIAHIETVKDDITMAVRKNLALDGGIKSKIEQKFTDNWFAFVKNVNGKAQYCVRSRPTAEFNAKTTLDLPDEFVFDNEVKKIQSQLL